MVQRARGWVGVCVALAGWAGTAACRPVVEGAIPCPTLGDSACPTGWQCAPSGTCEPGERVAELALRGSMPPGAGRVTLVFDVTPSDTVTTATARLEGSGSGVDLVPVLALASGGSGAGTLTVDVSTWLVPDGEAALQVALTASSGVVSHWRFPMVVAQTPAGVTVEQPASGAALRGAASVSATSTGSVPAARLVFALGAAQVTVTSAGEGGRFQGSLNVGALADGAAELAVTVTDEAGRTATTRVPVVVANRTASIDRVTVDEPLTPSSVAAGSRVHVFTSGVLAAAPVIEVLAGADLAFGEAQAGGTAGEWTFAVTGGTASGLVAWKVTASDAFGTALEKVGSGQVDFEVPRFVDGAVERREGTPVALSLVLQCSEAATAKVVTDTAQRDGLACGTTPTRVTLQGTQVTSVRLDDGKGNAGALADWDVVRASVPAIAASAAVQAAAAFEVRAARLAASTPDGLTSADGAGPKFSRALQPPSVSLWTGSPPDALVGTTRRPWLWRGPSEIFGTTLLAWLQDGDMAAGYAIAPNASGMSLSPWVRLPASGRPAVTDGRVLWWLTPTQLVQRNLAELGPTAVAIPGALDETHVCGGTFFGVSIVDGRATAYWRRTSGVITSQVIAGAGSALRPEVQARTTCAGRWPVVVVHGPTLLELHALADPEASFRTDALVGTPPVARDGLCLGPEGLLGGGLNASGAPVADLWRLGEAGVASVSAAGTGPKRSDATLLDVDGDVVVVGGRSTTGVTRLVSRKSAGFTEESATSTAGVRQVVAWAGIPGGRLEVIATASGLRLDPGGATIAGASWASIVSEVTTGHLLLLGGPASGATTLYDCGTLGGTCTARASGVGVGPSRLVSRPGGVLLAFPVAGGLPYSLDPETGAAGLVTFSTSYPGENAVTLSPDRTSVWLTHATTAGGAPAQRFTSCDVTVTSGVVPCVSGPARAVAAPAVPARIDARTQVVLTRQGFMDLTNGDVVPFPMPVPAASQVIDVVSAGEPTGDTGQWVLRDPAMQPSVATASRGFQPAAVVVLPEARRVTGTVRARAVGGFGVVEAVVRHAGGVVNPSFQQADGWYTHEFEINHEVRDGVLLVTAGRSSDSEPEIEVDTVRIEAWSRHAAP